MLYSRTEMVAKKLASLYTIRKSKQILNQIYRTYRRKVSLLQPAEKERLQTHMTSLRTAILQKEAETAHRMASQLEEISHKLLPKTAWDRVRNFLFAIGSALILAIAIRQSWFEPYSIPTGSMRPTLKENDLLLVSKTDYGINIPLTTSHLYFDPSLVQRGSIVVFTGKNMDIPDVDTMYFYLFPGKKMFVKRLIGKPGDILYFYGGQIYGINAQGEELKELRDPPWFQTLEHIPFIRFDGKVETPTPPTPYTHGAFSPAVLYQMNIPVAKLSINPLGKATGEMLFPMSHYSDLWGFGNFAMARLLNAKEMEALHPGALRDLSPAPLYLELSHHPTIHNPQLVRDEQGRLRPDVGYSLSFLPLQGEQIDKIGKELTTCRFVVKEGIGWRLGYDPKNFAYRSHFPKMAGIPDGTYEFQNGKASRVLWGGITQELSEDHPIYPKTAEQVQFFYNLGVEFFDMYQPTKQSRAHPSRYAYFRDHKLYLLGAPILEKDDPALVRFLQREYQKQSIATSQRPYFPFDDAGPPLTKEGKIDVPYLKKYGLTIPDKMYLALGDNHAMSADSRAFGFVPQENLRGGPSFLFWPPGGRWGRAPQPLQPHVTIPNTAVWGIALLIGAGSSLYVRRKILKPLNFKD